jgi:hypothetical protein
MSLLQDLDCCEYLLRRLPLTHWDLCRKSEFDNDSIQASDGVAFGFSGLSDLIPSTVSHQTSNGFIA